MSQSTTGQIKTAPLAEAAKWALDQMKAKKGGGPWEVIVTPESVGDFVTSFADELAIRAKAAAEVPKPPEPDGLRVEIKGFRPEGVLFVVGGLI